MDLTYIVICKLQCILAMQQSVGLHYAHGLSVLYNCISLLSHGVTLQRQGRI